jgi:hypothetical protein
MPTNRLSLDSACEILNPHKERIFRCGTIPFLRWQAEYPNQPLHSQRTRASAVNDLMVFQARREFDGVRGIRFIDLPHPYARTLMEIDGRVLLRFKLLDERGLAKNYRTRFIERYEHDRELPGIPPRPHRMTLGYVLNLMQTGVSRVSVTSTIRGKIDYELSFQVPNGRIVSIADAEQLSARDHRSGDVVIRITRQGRIGE